MYDMSGLKWFDRRKIYTPNTTKEYCSHSSPMSSFLLATNISRDDLSISPGNKRGRESSRYTEVGSWETL